MHLKIITHERVVYDEDVDEVYTKTIDGEIGILKNHVPFMTGLNIGVTKTVKEGNVKFFTTMGGVLQFKDNEILILARAKAKLAESEAQTDAKRAEAAIARAMARLKATLNT